MMATDLDKPLAPMEMSQDSYDWGDNWNKYNQSGNRIFLQKIEDYCLDWKCRNDRDRMLLKNTIYSTWKCYSKVLKLKQRKWKVSSRYYALMGTTNYRIK